MPGASCYTTRVHRCDGEPPTSQPFPPWSVVLSVRAAKVWEGEHREGAGGVYVAHARSCPMSPHASFQPSVLVAVQVHVHAAAPCAPRPPSTVKPRSMSTSTMEAVSGHGHGDDGDCRLRDHLLYLDSFAIELLPSLEVTRHSGSGSGRRGSRQART